MANILSLLIFIAVPSLLSGVKINSSTSSIDVIVDVNEGINCDTSQLSTRTTVSDGNRVIYVYEY